MPDGMAIAKPRKGKLLAVAPETVEPKKSKVLIYGPPGVGKTWNRKARADLNREYRGECKSTGAAEHYHRLLTAISRGLA